VSGDHHLHAGEHPAVERLDVVDHVEPDALRLQRRLLRQRLRPGAVIVVPAHRHHRPDLAEGGQDPGAAHVPGVDDQLRSGQRLQRFGPEETVGVGDDTDAGHVPIVGQILRPALGGPERELRYASR
jgi:hypothetical protein